MFRHMSIDFEKPIPVKGRKSYNNAIAVSIRISENKAFGFAVTLMLLVDELFRKIQWKMLSDKEKICIQKALGI